LYVAIAAVIVHVIIVVNVLVTAIVIPIIATLINAGSTLIGFHLPMGQASIFWMKLS
jgi:hypothetical protein